MPHSKRIFLGFAALALSAAPALAQYATPGARIRITTSAISGEQVVGRLAALTADSLAVMIGGGATLTLDARDIERLELSRGRPRAQWAATGAAIGLIGSTVLFTLTHGPVYGTLGGFVVGAVVAAPLGAGIGAFAAQERWTPYPLPTSKW